MTNQEAPANLRLHYTIMCEDVRVEINHKLSLMGIFYAIQVQQLPVTLLKIVILKLFKIPHLTQNIFLEN